ncbi:M24 family metallopeptidase [soil metagenome]
MEKYNDAQPVGLLQQLIAWVVTRFFNLPAATTGEVTKPLTDEEIAGFRVSQKLAYDCAQAAAKELRPGWTEGGTQQWMVTYLRDHGVKTWLHKPIVAFGARTLAPDEQWSPARGTGLTLQENDVAILDCAPILGGYTGDIAYTVRIGDNPEMEKALDFLARLRAQIPAQFTNTNGNVYEWVTEKMREAGYQNAAGGYVGNILGHRVYKHGKFASSFPYFLPEQLFGYMLSWHSPGFLLKVANRLVFPEELGPFHNTSKLGIWAIEPHVRVGNFGVKLEELLVVNDEGAFWLDDASQI